MAQSLAVLVDGDNVSGKHAEEILSVAVKHGEPAVVRVYADAQRSSEWHGAIGHRGFMSIVLTFRKSSGEPRLSAPPGS